jgi:hypothetical protein
MFAQFDPDKIDWYLFFNGLAHEQHGGGYRGMRYQTGGNILQTAAHYLIPLLKSAGKSLLREGAIAAGRLVGDVASGKPFNSAAKKRGGKAVRRLLREAHSSVKRQQSGTGVIRRRKKRKSIVIKKKKKQSGSGKRRKRVTKKQKSRKRKNVKRDTLGDY